MKIIPLSPKDAARQKNIFLPLFSAEGGSASGGQKESPGKEELFSYLPPSHQMAVKELCKKEFHGDEGETKSVWFPKGRINRIRLFGWGDKQKWNYRKNQLVARRYVQYAKGERISELTTPFGASLGTNKKAAASIFASSAVMAGFDFNKYKEAPKNGWPEVKTIYLAADKKDFLEIQRGIREGMIVGEEVNACRELSNTPGGDMTPRHLAQAATTSAKKFGVRAKILDEKQMKRLNMGGVLGVARGSDEKPRFIILEYMRGPKGQKPLVLVGKGVTFDTGGLNLKPDQYIYEMHMDMSGGAAVIHGITAIARLKLPINVVGLIPAVENMPSGSSYRPGDLLKTMSGKTIEVLNTDAEGRVILSDALYYGATKYKPGLMVDLATLTGAAHVALGSYCSAVFTKDEKLQEKLVEVGKNSGDYMWPLPLWDEYLPEIKGTFGDLANAGKGDRYGGAIQGAKFLEQFVGKTPWAHFDIAPRMTTVDSEYLSKGASGVGVRYIVELAKEYKSFTTPIH
ncbi:MAG: leucyl aminopeptidase family protein [Candidatus Sungbacteria bacterium]|nr:leucyl aminopeptidase family protein [Candidatus Sungbacteria bacterium]